MQYGKSLFVALLFALTVGGGSAAAAPAPDIDLTAMSATMVYSVVYDMVWHPDMYVGQVVKMRGRYTRYTADDTETLHHACVV